MDRTVNKGAALDPAVDLLPLLAWKTRALPAPDRRGGRCGRSGSRDHGVVPLSPDAGNPRGRGGRSFSVRPGWMTSSACTAVCRVSWRPEPGESMPVLCVFHNEEVGSGTWQGADSTFLTDVLSRAAAALGRTGEAYQTSVAESFLVSADNAHAVHPAHPEYADKQEFPVLNGGVVVKYNANQHYTTDALSDAVFRDLCRRAEVPVQRYSNRADLPGGSTLGNISTSICPSPRWISDCPAGHAQLLRGGGRPGYGGFGRVMTAYFSAGIRRLPGGGMALA